MKSIMILFATTLAASTFAHPLDKAWIKGETDKNPLFYKIGEEIVITLTPMGVEGELPKGEYFLDWKRTGDDAVKDAGKLEFDGKTPFVYRTKLDKPGFVRLNARVVDKAGKKWKKKYTGDISTPEGKAAMNRFERRNYGVFFDGGAGVDIDTLRTREEPKDFDEFWAKQYKRLDVMPIEVKRVQCREFPNGKVYAVSIACVGLRPVTGYLSIPKAAEDGAKFPCRLTTHGYSGDVTMHNPPGGIRSDQIVLDINAFGMLLPALGGTEADRKALWWAVHDGKKTGHAFSKDQNIDPESVYFNGMVLRVKRALQYLKTLPEWNGKDLWASGGSQGGLQTIWAAACGEGVTKAESCITWCCDMYTSGELRNNPKNNLSSDGWYIPWTEALGYYDAANFAKRIDPKVCFTDITRAGIGDYCCPPMGLAKLWNNLKGNKRITWVQGSEHGYVPPAYPNRDFVREEK